MMPIRFVPKAEIDRLRAAIRDPHRQCAALADASRLNTLSMIMYAGSGHIGTSFSSMDLVCWLWTRVLEDPVAHAREDGELYFSSKGHDVPGLYAMLIGLGRMEESAFTTLRRLHGLPGHPDVGVPYMITNTGPLGMGISKARGMAIANRLAGKRARLFVLLGDGELQEGQFWESLQPTVNGQFSEITAIVDHNKIQTDTFVRDVSDLGDIEAKVRAFGWQVARCDGHDCASIERGLAALDQAGPRPRLLIADTIKGQGVSFMRGDAMGEDGLYKFHSGAPSPEHYETGLKELRACVDAALAAAGAEPLSLREVPFPERFTPEKPERLIPAYGDELLRLGKQHSELVVLDGDLMVDCGTLPFKRELPERFFECGIAEQDMVSAAGALALKGKIPVVHSFACFLSTRPNEQIYNNATEGTKVIYHASLAGLLPAVPGHSHQSVRDISTIGSVPGLVMIQPCNEEETRQALRFAVDQHPGSSYLRLVTIPVAIPYALPAGYALELGRGVMLKEGRDGAIIAYGPVMLSEAFRAAQELEQRGRSLAVFNLPWLNRVDGAWLSAALGGFDDLFLIEDHYPELGQSAFVTQALCTQGLSPRVRIFGVEEIPVCGQAVETLEHHELSTKRLVERIGAALTA
jgi:transketolase